jgi:branched-chain amino acid transport system substrate-binding protein
MALKSLYYGGYHPEAGLLARQLEGHFGEGCRSSAARVCPTPNIPRSATTAPAGTLFTNASDALKSPDSARPPSQRSSRQEHSR